MNKLQRFVYIEELLIHANVALREWEALVALMSDPNLRQSRELWVRLQSFLSHYGMVSKLLFAPSSKRDVSKKRAKELRAELGISDDSKLNDRDARNAVEHLDDRMDYWLEVEGKGILECVYETKADYAYLDPNRWMVRRVIIADAKVFISQDKDGRKEMELLPLVEALKELSTTCADKLAESKDVHRVG